METIYQYHFYFLHIKFFQSYSSFLSYINKITLLLYAYPVLTFPHLIAISSAIIVTIAPTIFYVCFYL